MPKIWKIILSVLALLIIAVGGWFLFFLYGPKLAFEDVLPEGAIVFARLEHPVTHWQNGMQSEFWKNISAINVPKVLDHNKVPKAFIDQYTQAQKKASDLFNNPLVQRFLGKEIAVAVYQHKEADPADPLGYGFLVIARPSPSVRLMEIFSNFSPRFGDDIRVSQEMYSQQRIVHVHFKNNQAMAYTQLGDMFIFAAENEPALKTVIDVNRHKMPPLRRDRHFLFAQSRAYAQGEGFMYVRGDVAPVGMAFNTYAVSFMPGPISKYKFIFEFNPLAVDPAMKQLLSCQARPNAPAGFVPSGIIGYFWSGCADFPEMSRQIQEQMQAVPEGSAPIKKFKKSMEKRLGFKLGETLLPLLTNEAGGYLTDVDTRGVIPYPRFLAFLKIADRRKTDELLAKLALTPMGLLKQEEYGQIPIHYLDLPLGGNMDPGYCFINDYLLAATSRQLLKKSIDTYKDQLTSLRMDKTFVSFGLNAKVQSVGFLKVGDLARRLRDLLDWGNKYLSSQVSAVSLYKQEGQKKKKELAGDMVSTEAELKQALEKMQEWQAKPTADLAADEAATLAQTIANFQNQEETLRDDIKTNRAQQQEIDDILSKYEDQAENYKLFMFNSQQVLVPILKGFETIHAQGFKVMVNAKAIETEMILK